jgi:3-methyladenine DNA glycosylase AlkC
MDSKSLKYYKECLNTYKNLQDDKSIPNQKKLSIIVDQIELNHNFDDF